MSHRPSQSISARISMGSEIARGGPPVDPLTVTYDEGTDQIRVVSTSLLFTTDDIDYIEFVTNAGSGWTATLGGNWIVTNEANAYIASGSAWGATFTEIRFYANSNTAVVMGTWSGSVAT